MRDEEIFGLLVATNPVADPDGLDSPLALAELGRRSGPLMQTNQRTVQTPPRPKGRRGMLAGAAFLAVIAAGVGLFLAVRADDRGADATDAAPVESQSPDGVEELGRLPGTSWAYTDDPSQVECCLDQQLILRFGTDGTFSLKTPDSSREDAGTYTIADDVIAFTSEDGFPCSGGTGRYTLDFPSPGRVTFDIVSDTCSGRADAANGLELIQIDS